MQKLLLVLMFMFTIIFSFGASSMEAGIANPIINYIMLIVGLIGFSITAWKYLKICEDNRKKRIASNEEQLKAIEKMIPSIKLKDDGSNIDEEIEILKENNIKINYKHKGN